TITIIYQIVGYSTKEFAQLNEGDELTDFVGPLGVPKVLHEAKHVIGVAGGVGRAPLFPQLRELANRGVD
ncbi:sulfide/dihydroorotate dehydrogenase-like FAD/NAD-binding protein, partial [Erysipelatoclostridium ramosum]|nr:sulfide/dihydroorotate dehydrogenase-like FAD/NAD-binding protein [Thomasclavelia ramosa]